MNQSQTAFNLNLEAVLLADAGLANWATTHYGKGLTAVRGNCEVAKIRPGELPALVMEIGDGESEIETMDGEQRVESEVICAIVFSQDDPALAYQQRMDLIGLMMAALHGNRTLDTGTGEAVDACWLAGWESDRGSLAQHPRHWISFTVQGTFTVDFT